MKKRILRLFCGVLAGSMMLSAIPFSAGEGKHWEVLHGTVTVLAEDAVTVTDYEEFKTALANEKKHIIVGQDFSIRDEQLVETNGQMKPIDIPGGTTITGNGTLLTSSHPIQIMGDGVVLQNIQLQFISTDSMGSVPHREIFLAGHSLTLDNVNTYRVGGNSVSGSFEGTEKELLPTIYAGGYHSNSIIGNNASLTVQNAPDGQTNGTMFQAIYMGHEAKAGEKTAYTGKAVLNLDADTKVREGIFTEKTAEASITFLGAEDNDEIKPQRIKGNANTALKLSHCVVSETVAEGIGSVVIADQGRFQPNGSTELKDVQLQNGGCLDLSKMDNTVLTGDFSSVTGDKKGILVLAVEGTLRIEGTVSGVTQFQVGNHTAASSTLKIDHAYITAKNAAEENFVLSNKDLDNYYGIKYENGTFITYQEGQEGQDREAYDVQVNNSLSEVSLADIPADITKIKENSPYLELVWSDQYGEDFTAEEALKQGFYKNIIVMRSDYWESDKDADKLQTDWSNSIKLENDGVNPERYYLIASDKDVKAGVYNIFLSSVPVTGLKTVQDVKNLMDEAILLNVYDYNKIKIAFTGKFEQPEENPTPDTPEENPTPDKPEENPTPDKPEENPTPDKPEENPTPDKPEENPTPDKPEENPTPDKPEENPTPDKPEENPTPDTPEKDPTPDKPEDNPTPENPTHEHKYILASEKEATCQKEGIRKFSCNCGESYTEKIPKKSHKKKAITKKAKKGKNGSISTICSVCETVLDKKIIYAPKTMKLAKENYTYNGKSKKPAVKILDNKGKVISSSFYEIEYKDNKKIGRATVTVRLTGNYSGTWKKNFEISPSSTKILDIEAGTKTFKVKWKKQMSQTDGYQIAYATNKSFSKKNTKIISVKDNEVTSKKINNLKSDKKYYVRIRTYKDVRVNGKKMRVYSDWSKTEKITVK